MDRVVGARVIRDERGDSFVTANRKPGPLVVIRMDELGHLTTRKIKTDLKLADPRILVPSPSGGRYLLVPVALSGDMFTPPSGRAIPNLAERTGPIRHTGLIGVLNCGDTCALTFLRVKASAIWWQSENEIGYLDERGERHYLSAR